VIIFLKVKQFNGRMGQVDDKPVRIESSDTPLFSMTKWPPNYSFHGMRVRIANNCVSMSPCVMVQKYCLLRSLDMPRDIHGVILFLLYRLNNVYSTEAFHRYQEKIIACWEKNKLFDGYFWHFDLPIDLVVQPSLSQCAEIVCRRTNTTSWGIDFTPIHDPYWVAPRYVEQNLMALVMLPLFLSVQTHRCEWTIVEEDRDYDRHSGWISDLLIDMGIMVKDHLPTEPHPHLVLWDGRIIRVCPRGEFPTGRKGYGVDT
jgi:hypothetical protein